MWLKVGSEFKRSSIRTLLNVFLPEVSIESQVITIPDLVCVCVCGSVCVCVCACVRGRSDGQSILLDVKVRAEGGQFIYCGV